MASCQDLGSGSQTNCTNTDTANGPVGTVVRGLKGGRDHKLLLPKMTPSCKRICRAEPSVRGWLSSPDRPQPPAGDTAAGDVRVPARVKMMWRILSRMMWPLSHPFTRQHLDAQALGTSLGNGFKTRPDTTRPSLRNSCSAGGQVKTRQTCGTSACRW